MPQTQLLDFGSGSAFSASITLTAGQHGRIGLFATNSASLEGANAEIFTLSPGNDVLTLEVLSASAPVLHLIGPGSWKARRIDGPPCGVFGEQ